MEFFTVKQIAEKRGVSERAIYKQIKTHEAELEGHTSKINGKTWYDEVAVKILDDASSQSPAVYIEGIEKAEVEALKAENANLKAELDEDRKAFRKMYALIEESKTNAKLVAESQMYLEQKEELARKNEKLEKELESAKREVEETAAKDEEKMNEIIQERERLEKENERLKEELEAEKNKSWWQKIFK